MKDNGFEDYSYSQGCRAVVQTEIGTFHGFASAETARRRVKNWDDCVPGIWRLKECKA